MTLRLQKFIASSGLVSRRKAEELIAAGRVSVNDRVVIKLGTTVNPDKDVEVVNGEKITPATAFRYLAFNKPAGVVCTRAQYKNERTVYDIIPDVRDLVIVGRLDKDSEGLILLTNDGELVNQLTHPRYQHAKEYEVVTAKPLAPEAIASLQRGVKLQEGWARFDKLTVVEPMRFRGALHQGWKRQIRRMVGEVHGHITRLTRIRLEKLELGDLPTGGWRETKRSQIL